MERRHPPSGGHPIYNLLLGCGIVLSAPAWIPWVLMSGKRRKNFPDRLGVRMERVPHHAGGERIWIHSVSVGETLSAVPMIRRMKEDIPGIGIVLSTVTLTGQDVAARSLGNGVDGLFFFPFDVPRICRLYLDRVRPAMVVIMETEIWPNFLAECRRRGIPAVVLNGRISERSFRNYKRFPSLFSRVLGCLSAITAQTEEDAKRFVALGAPPENVFVTGNVKFDVSPPAALSPLHGWMESEKERGATWVVAGSTHDGEEVSVLRAYGKAREIVPSLRLLLAPRHPERFQAVETLCEAEGFPAVRRTSLDEGNPTDAKVILLDTVGELLSAYAAADIAFVGGSLVPKGGHNILEPALFGVPTLIGPHMDNFREIESIFLHADAVAQVPDGARLEERLCRFAGDPAPDAAMGERARRCLEGFRGATSRNVEIVKREFARRKAQSP